VVPLTRAEKGYLKISSSYSSLHNLFFTRLDKPHLCDSSIRFMMGTTGVNLSVSNLKMDNSTNKVLKDFGISFGAMCAFMLLCVAGCYAFSWIYSGCSWIKRRWRGALKSSSQSLNALEAGHGEESKKDDRSDARGQTYESTSSMSTLNSQPC
jgi:hypothetical protein